MTRRRKMTLTILGIIVVALLAAYVDFPRNEIHIGRFALKNPFSVHLALDLQGGTELTYQADVSQLAAADQSDALGSVRDVIERRVNSFGVSEPVIETEHSGNSWRVIVDLPGVTDVNQAIKLIGETPLLEFKEQNDKATADASAQEQAVQQYNDDAQKRAQDVLQKVLAPNADFSALAKQYSEDTGSKDNGGDLGFIKLDTVVPEFAAAVKTLKVGDTTQSLVQSTFGYHIIKLVDQKTDSDGTVEYHVSHILIATKSVDQNALLASQYTSTGLSGKQLQRALVEFDQTTGAPTVSLQFNSDGAKLFADITKRNIGKQVAIFLDGQIISAPVVQQQITGGQAVISGSFTADDAKQLATRLNAGALPVPISLISQQNVGATLGQTSVERSIKAGIIGLLLVAVYMIIIYRLPGVLSVIALMLYTAIAFAAFKLIPVTLSLAGIAGFILSIGLAVDANVLIFERLKEELRKHHPLRDAIEKSFKHAWPSIRDANTSSLITTSILIIFGTSFIRGFAITLAIGVLTSLLTAVIVSMALLRMVSNEKLESFLWLFGVNQKPDSSQPTNEKGAAK